VVVAAAVEMLAPKTAAAAGTESVGKTSRTTADLYISKYMSAGGVQRLRQRWWWRRRWRCWRPTAAAAGTESFGKTSRTTADLYISKYICPPGAPNGYGGGSGGDGIFWQDVEEDC